MQTVIDWTVISPNQSYLGDFGLEDSTKLELENLLDHQLTAKGPDPGPPTECCTYTFHGFNQINASAPLFIFGTGQGLQNVYGEGNTYRFNLYTGCESDIFLAGYSRVPNNSTWECQGFDNWYTFSTLYPEDWSDKIECIRVKATRSHGYIPTGGNYFDYIPVCGDEIELEWGENI